MPVVVVSVTAAAAAGAAAAAFWRPCRAAGAPAPEAGGAPAPAREDPAACSVEDMFAEVAQRSKAVLYTVSNKGNDQFSLPNLSKYLRMKGVDVHEGSTREETLQVNAARLLELLDRQDAGKGEAAGKQPQLLRHAHVLQAIPKGELEVLLPAVQDAYVQQQLDYGDNSRYSDKWKISCYLVVMENWKPKIMPHEPMVQCLSPIMHRCVEAYTKWYCRTHSLKSVDVSVMNGFVTRYRAVHDEDQLKKHIDGSNVDGSVILALPTDDPFEGGALHVWDGKPQQEFVYRPQPGDTIFLDGAVWHQAMPITCGTRWALVLFLRVRNRQAFGGIAAAA